MIGTLYRNEIRMLLRDRRTIITSIILPLLVTPLMLFSSAWTTKQRQTTLDQTTYKYAVLGPQAAEIRSLIEETRKFWTGKTNHAHGAVFRFEEAKSDDPTNSLTKGDIHFILEGLRADPDYKAKKDGDEQLDLPRSKLPSRLDLFRFTFRADRDDSSSGVKNLQAALRDTRRNQRELRLSSGGSP